MNKYVCITLNKKVGKKISPKKMALLPLDWKCHPPWRNQGGHKSHLDTKNVKHVPYKIRSSWNFTKMCFVIYLEILILSPKMYFVRTYHRGCPESFLVETSNLIKMFQNTYR